MFQEILAGLQGLGGGFAKGIGSSYGLPFELTKTMGKMTGAGAGLPMDIYSPYYLPGKGPSVWERIGSMLGTRAGRSKAPTLPSTPSFDTSTRVAQSPGYRKMGGKSQLETLLSQLARR